MNKNSVLILTTDSEFYQYIKQAIPGEAQSLSVPVSRGLTPYAGNVGRYSGLRGKMPVVIVRRVSGSSISCNDGQEPIGKETSWKRPSYPKKTARADDLIQLIRSKVITGKNITI
jgi:hypothetical protein